jgi:hypothetical protein
VNTWAARCMSSGGRVGRKDAILEMGVLCCPCQGQRRVDAAISGVGEEERLLTLCRRDETELRHIINESFLYSDSRQKKTGKEIHSKPQET